jgi:hypothetical protein
VNAIPFPCIAKKMIPRIGFDVFFRAILQFSKFIHY